MMCWPRVDQGTSALACLPLIPYNGMGMIRALVFFLFAGLWFGPGVATSERTHAQSRAAAGAASRPHEVSLARLRPGKDYIAEADRIYSREMRAPLPGSSGQPEWYDACTGYFLRVEVDDQGVIQSVTISALGPRRDDCAANSPDFLNRRYWKTGRGLALGDTRKRALALYGPPDSSGPSTQQGRELQLLFYSYEELGAGVPQIMEITLEKDRVVQVTLAFPGL